MAKRPNVLMFITHDTGRHLGCYGRKVATPNLDALANSGVVFENYFCTAPQCSPSRASILSGKWPHNHGLIGLTHRGFAMSSYDHLLPKLMAEAGLDTWLFGMQHEIHGPASTLGYRHRQFDQQRGNGCQVVTPFVLDYLRSGPKQPFYACVGYSETHRPFPHSDVSLAAVEPVGYLPDVDAVRQDVADLEVLVRRVDDHVGQVVDALKDAGLYDDTLIVFTTDHGVAMPRAKATLFDAGVETALIMKFPHDQHAGTRVRAMALNIDYLPTLCDFVGVDVPTDVQGVSLMPLVRGETASAHDALFFEMTYHAAYDPMRAARTPRHKYIRSFVERPMHFAPNTDAGHAKEHLRAEGWYDAPRPAEQLYDLGADPYEQSNVIDDPAYAEVADELRTRLREWMESTGDPLLAGQVPAPVGARVTRPAAYEAGDTIVVTADSPIE
ncbi:MAG TPA: sulfatase [Phycisphaerae bacterium]|nr:sulfatase [Phycisphaerae bacterium]